MAVMDEHLTANNLYLDTEDKLVGKEWTDEEKVLLDFIYENSSLFDDMLFAEESITHSLVCVQIDNDGNGDWTVDDTVLLPDEIVNFSYNFFDFNVCKLDGGSWGCFDSRLQSLSIDPEHLNDEPTILHEMIHLHEFVLDCLPSFYHDVYLFCIYKSLKNRIADLDNRVESHGHILNEQYIQQLGGLHDVLFLLKSYDLDLRKGYELGTVLGNVYSIHQ